MKLEKIFSVQAIRPFPKATPKVKNTRRDIESSLSNPLEKLFSYRGLKQEKNVLSVDNEEVKKQR